MVPQKVQLSEEDLRFIEAACVAFRFKSKSEYMRVAIQEKIRTDRRRLRERRRQQAMLAYDSQPDVVFETLEGEDFEDR